MMAIRKLQDNFKIYRFPSINFLYFLMKLALATSTFVQSLNGALKKSGNSVCKESLISQFHESKVKEHIY